MVFPFGGKSCRFIPFSKVLNRFKCKVNSRDTVMPIIFTIGWRPGEKIITIQKVDRQAGWKAPQGFPRNTFKKLYNLTVFYLFLKLIKSAQAYSWMKTSQFCSGICVSNVLSRFWELLRNVRAGLVSAVLVLSKIAFVLQKQMERMCRNSSNPFLMLHHLFYLAAKGIPTDPESGLSWIKNPDGKR